MIILRPPADAKIILVLGDVSAGKTSLIRLAATEITSRWEMARRRVYESWTLFLRSVNLTSDQALPNTKSIPLLFMALNFVSSIVPASMATIEISS